MRPLTGSPKPVRNSSTSARCVEHLELGDALDALPPEGPEQPRGDQDVLAGPELPLDLPDDARVVRGRAGEEDQRGLGRELRAQVDGNPDHADEAVQEVLARRVVGLVALHADRLPELAQDRVDLLERPPRHAGHRQLGREGAVVPPVGPDHLVEVEARPLPLPGGAVTLVDGDLHLAEVEERDLGRLGEEGDPQLLRVAVEGAHSPGVDPSPRVVARAEVLQVAPDLVPVVRLQVLGAAHRVARLGARVDRVEDLRLRLQVEPQAVEVVVPVRVLDDHLHPRVDLPRRSQDEVAGRLVQQRQAVLGPAPLAPRADLDLGLAAREEEVVEDDLVEVPRGVLDDLLHPAPVRPGRCSRRSRSGCARRWSG